MASPGSGPGNGQINFFMSQSRTTPSASRQSSPSHRKRHVKCGEEKPSCKRCLKWQGFCGGYDVLTQVAATSPSPVSARSSSIEAPNPGQSSQQQPAPPKRKETPRARAKARRRGSSQSLSEATSQPSLRPHESQAIVASWNDLMAALGAGFFEENFWKQIVPQLSQENPAVRYASMAIESVRRLVGDDAKYLSPPEAMSQSSAYDEALTYYGNAMQEMTKPLGAQHNLRATIVCCILFACFEIFSGDRKTAIAHVFNGKRMVDELWELTMQMPAAHQYGARKPLENDIVDVFQRLSLHAWASKGVESWMPPSEMSSHSILDAGRLSPEQMPNTFLSVADAGFWWQVTQHHILCGSPEDTSGTGGLTAPGTSNEGTSRAAAGHGSRRRRLDPLGPADTGDNDGDNATTFGMWLERWDSAFQPLLTKSLANRDGSPADFLQATCLRVQFLHLFTFVQSPIRLALERNDGLSGYLGEIIQLCTMMLPFRGGLGVVAPSNDYIFTSESAPSFALFAAVIRSRERRLGQDAYELLLQFVGEEQVWDSGRTDGGSHGGAMAVPTAADVALMHHHHHHGHGHGHGHGSSAASSASGWGTMEGGADVGEEWSMDNFMINDFG